MEVVSIPALEDNYIYLLHDPQTLDTVVIDPSQSAPVIKVLVEKKWELTHILLTHHHWDHVGGVDDLMNVYDCEVWGAEEDLARLPDLTFPVREGGEYDLMGQQVEVLFIPGHTAGHIAYYFPESKSVFCGDTLFSVGCGRLFEGTPEQMWESLTKLMSLPKDTLVYCAHEYTAANLKFALHLDPTNAQLIEKQRKVTESRAQGLPSVPTLLKEEISLNPFLRAQSAEEFGELRRAKDEF